jgi:hypothetical protein
VDFDRVIKIATTHQNMGGFGAIAFSSQPGVCHKCNSKGCIFSGLLFIIIIIGSIDFCRAVDFPRDFGKHVFGENCTFQFNVPCLI